MEDRFKIYRITNRSNDKVYIGITGMALKKRWQAHVSHARQGNKGVLLDAIRKYGSESFDVEHIASARSREDLHVAEQMVIKQYGSYGNGYNASEGGGGPGTGIVWSEETKRLRAESYKRTLARQGGSILKGVPRGAAVSANLSLKMKGRVFSAETRAKMSAAQKRRVFTQTEKDRLKRDGERRRAASRLLTDEQVAFARNQRAEGVRFVDLAKFYKVGESVMQSAVKGHTYAHVPMAAWRS